MEGGINDHGDDWQGCFPNDWDPMQQSTKQQHELDCKSDGEIAMPQKAKGDDVGRGRGVGLEGGRQGGNAEAYNAGEQEADNLFFDMIALRARGRKQGQCRPQSRGWHLHGSPVRAQACWW
jgi:hypothetical protein